jgi:hypothetical protein
VIMYFYSEPKQPYLQLSLSPLSPLPCELSFCSPLKASSRYHLSSKLSSLLHSHNSIVSQMQIRQIMPGSKMAKIGRFRERAQRQE